MKKLFVLLFLIVISCPAIAQGNPQDTAYISKYNLNRFHEQVHVGAGFMCIGIIAASTAMCVEDVYTDSKKRPWALGGSALITVIGIGILGNAFNKLLIGNNLTVQPGSISYNF